MSIWFKWQRKSDFYPETSTWTVQKFELLADWRFYCRTFELRTISQPKSSWLTQRAILPVASVLQEKETKVRSTQTPWLYLHLIIYKISQALKQFSGMRKLKPVTASGQSCRMQPRKTGGIEDARSIFAPSITRLNCHFQPGVGPLCPPSIRISSNSDKRKDIKSANIL